MNKQTAFEKLKAMANEPQDSLKKFLAIEILTHDEPLDFSLWQTYFNFY